MFPQGASRLIGAADGGFPTKVEGTGTRAGNQAQLGGTPSVRSRSRWAICMELSRRAFLIMGLSMILPMPAPRARATEAGVAALEPFALGGDRYSIRALFALHSRADGAVAECADIVLGCTICKFPRLFLEELEFSRRVRRIDSLLGNLGPDFVDDYERQRSELMERKAALTSVCSGSLKTVGNLCIEMLDGQISCRGHLAQSIETRVAVRRNFVCSF